MLKIITPLLQEGRDDWNEQIKMLLYKSDENIFDYIDFENEQIYSNPLLNLYFSIENNPEKLRNILLAHWIGEKKYLFDINEKIGYIPDYGWIYNRKFADFSNAEIEGPKILIKENKIELLPHKFQLLEYCFGKYEYDIDKTSCKSINHLTKAYILIKKNLPEYFELIEKYCPRCVLFNTSPSNTNSFAYRRALGISFYNAYQEKYDEVFFVDDIAHQTGHILMYTMLFNKQLFFTIDDENTTIQSLAMPNKIESNRSVEIWFHALYTYYASFICLDASLDKNDFSERQRIEALGRILLYVHRCYYDLQLYYESIPGTDLFRKIPEDYKFIESTPKNIFTKTGKAIFDEIRNKWIAIYDKYYDVVKDFNLNGQFYNFDLEIFIKNNPECIK